MSNNKSNQHPGMFLGARVTSIFSVALVLFMLGLLAMNFFLANRLSSFVKEHISFSVILKDEAKESDIQKMISRLEKARFVKSCDYVSKERALNYLIEELGDDPKEFLGYNPLYASIEVYLKSDYANNDSIAVIEKQLRAQSNIREVLYRKDLIGLVNDNIRKVGFLLAVLASVLMAISFALISNTIRLSVYSKRFLINTMKLVGATYGFIRRPFIVSNIINGVVAALLALAMLYGLVYYLSVEIDSFSSVFTLEDMLMVGAVVILFGVLLSAVSAFFAVNKYLRMKSDKLYYV